MNNEIIKYLVSLISRKVQMFAQTWVSSWKTARIYAALLPRDKFLSAKTDAVTATELGVPLNCFIMTLAAIITATWHKYAYF